MKSLSSIGVETPADFEDEDDGRKREQDLEHEHEDEDKDEDDGRAQKGNRDEISA